MKKISLGAWRKFHTCPRMYKYHYIDKLRPEVMGSSLYFGVAMDEALNHLLAGGKRTIEVFKESFEFDDVEHAEFGKYDIDRRLLTTKQLQALEGEPENKVAWACLRVKGRMLLEEYQRTILPKIERVYEIQRELPDRPGFIDVIAEIEGEGKVLLDHKTSSRAYAEDAAQNDAQLARYAASMGIDKIGFIVLVKNIDVKRRKTCTECGNVNTSTNHTTCDKVYNGTRCGGKWLVDYDAYPMVQLIIDDVPDYFQNEVVKDFKETEQMIDDGQFPRIINACNKYYGKQCPYYNYCWNGKKDGLIKKEDS